MEGTVMVVKAAAAAEMEATEAQAELRGKQKRKKKKMQDLKQRQRQQQKNAAGAEDEFAVRAKESAEPVEGAGALAGTPQTEAAILLNERTTGKDAKPATEIDSIFTAAKQKRKQQQQQQEADKFKARETSEGKAGSKKRRKGEAKHELDQPASTVRRRKTNDGYAIYSTDELKWGRKEAGGSSLCPFDCDCCF